METVIYTRISSVSNNESYKSYGKYSLISCNNQYDNCKNYCIEHNINLNNHLHISEVGSAWKKLNKQYELTKLINKKKNINLIINSVCRFSRYLLKACTLLELAEKNNIVIHFVNEQLRTDNKENIHMIQEKVIIAEQESNACSNRQLLAIKNKKNKGWYFGRSSYGYKIETVNNIRKNVIKIDEHIVFQFLKNINDIYNSISDSEITMENYETYVKRELYLMLKKLNYEVTESEVEFRKKKDNIINFKSNVANTLNYYNIKYRNNLEWSGATINYLIKNFKHPTAEQIEYFNISDVNLIDYYDILNSNNINLNNNINNENLNSYKFENMFKTLNIK